MMFEKGGAVVAISATVAEAWQRCCMAALSATAAAALRRHGGSFQGRKHGIGMSKGEGGHEGCNYLAHRIGLDFISLPGQQWPSKTITVQGSRRARLIKF